LLTAALASASLMAQEVRTNIQSGELVFRADTREVVLHVTVADKRDRLVTDLGQANFRVFENGQPVAIKFFRQEDVPVSIGILVDNSGSMRDKRLRVNAAALEFVKASNPEDEMFIVNFNDEATPTIKPGFKTRCNGSTRVAAPLSTMRCGLRSTT
jgi:predicted metal-dependent peptidase